MLVIFFVPVQRAGRLCGRREEEIGFAADTLEFPSYSTLLNAQCRIRGEALVNGVKSFLHDLA
jgi:hypothetical protein